MSRVGLFGKRSSEDASVPERLLACAERRDVRALLTVLDGLDDEGWEAARRWYRTGRASVRQAAEPRGFRVFEKFLEASRVESVLCVALAPPASAAKWLRWDWMGQSVQLVAPVVVRRGADWCREFVAAIDARPVRGDRWGQVRDTYALLRPAVDAHDLPTPTGPAFVEGWLIEVGVQTHWSGGQRLDPDPQALAEKLRAEPRLDDLVAPALAHPELGQHAVFASAFALLAADGRLDRSRLVDLCLRGLDSPGRPATQKALAEALVLVGLGSDDVGGGLARLQQLLATCHGSVTSRLLPLALELVATEDDLVELTTTVGARPEKKQRTELLRAITRGSIADRLPPEGRRAALEILAESQDAALAGKAARALESLGVGAFPAAPTNLTALGLWDRSPPRTPAPMPEPVTEPAAARPDVEAVIREVAGASSWQLLPPWREPVALSLLVRWAARDGARSVRRAIRKVELAQHDPTPFGTALAGWLAKRTPPAWEPIVPQDNGYVPNASVLAERHLRESLHRAGRAPFLLSTPTHTDASIDFGVLVERLRHSARSGFGPLDLLMAILRLGPVQPERAAALDGLSPVTPDLSADTRTRVGDAVAYLRDLVAAGRLVPAPITAARMQAEGWVPTKQPEKSPGRVPDNQQGQGRSHLGPHNQPADGFWAAMLPVALDDFATPVEELTARYAFGHHSRTVLQAVFPWQPDLRLRPGGLWLDHVEWWHGFGHLDSRGPRGPACHDLLLGGYAAGRPGSRQEMVDLTLAWIGADRYDADVALAASWARLRLGKLNLARCATAWEQVFLAGGMRAAWPVALGTAAIAADLPRKPAGLADLLRMLTQYVGEVPSAERSLPPSVVALAEAKGSTKSHAEARLLVRAQEGR